MAPTAAPFPDQTAWSVVLGAADRSGADYRSRLDSLIRRYWKPVWWYLVRHWKCSPEDAADLAQEFFSRLLEEDFLAHASPERGRFRTFIKLKLHDLVIDELRYRSRQKRGGTLKVVSIDRDDDSGTLQMQWPGMSPEEQFDRVWAACLMSTALKELRKKLEAAGHHDMIKAFWECTVDRPEKLYRECAREMDLKVADVGNLIFRARAELRKILAGLVRETVQWQDEGDDEMNRVLRLLES